MYYVSIPRDLLASLHISADMFLLTFTQSEVFDVVQLHDSGTTPFKNQSI